MTQVTKESLAAKIRRLELVKETPNNLVALSINEEYQLEAYKMLLDCLRNEEADRQMQDEFYQGRL